MKLTKEELIKKISEKIDDDELKMELLEDVADSVDVAEEVTVSEDEMKELSNKLEELSWKYEDLKTKYIERFLGGSEEVEEEKETEEKDEVIDVKEI